MDYIDQYIEVLQAFKKGEKIEVKSKNAILDSWSACADPIFNFCDNCYRVKPQQKYIPFSLSNNLIGEVVTLHGDQWMITGQTKERVFIGTASYSYEELYSKFTFKDGSPCGLST